MSVSEKPAGPGAAAARRQAFLDQLRRILPPSPPWEAWLEKTGELPPDFDSLPSIAGLPDPLLRQVDGCLVPVNDAQEWAEQRQALKALLHHWLLGTVPPPPEDLQATVVHERPGAGATMREVELTFGPARQATLRLELLVPDGPGPFPVFLTQYSHRGWALIALRRGYLCCLYAGCDSYDDTDTFLDAYPGYDWSRLTRRAWAASRCIDFLATVPQADVARVVLTGHSRNGKQSLIASALDERVAAVISSSSGAGGSMAARFDSEQHFGEGIELLTRVFPDWFHPRLRFFVGREQKLPVDLHELVALSAPRPCLLSIALNDGVESTWAMQQTYLSVRRVYRLLEAEERLRTLWRPGAHETDPTLIERYLDWSDAQLRSGAPAQGSQRAFPERFIHPWDWEAWREVSREQVPVTEFPRNGLDDVLVLDDRSAVRSIVDWDRKREQVRAKVQWMLGEPLPAVVNPGGRYGSEPPHVATLLGRGSPGEGLEKAQVNFGEYINGDVYLAAGLRETGRQVPAVLWLHPFSFPTGYVASYRRNRAAPGAGEIYRALALQGFAVFCFDQIGCGRRVAEAEGFYDRYPHGSLLGKMVRDAQAALDALARLEYVDAGQIWGVGYGLGSLVGLHLGASDGRLAGFASICGPPPFRLDTLARGTGGIRRWSHLHVLLPRLGFWVGEEDRVPYDVHHLLACFAPRPLLVISPQLDREARLEDVTRAVEAAQQVYELYGAAGHLEQLAPEDYNHFGPAIQAPVIEWLRRVSRSRL
jgi:dienelactone hydrolase